MTTLAPKRAQVLDVIPSITISTIIVVSLGDWISAALSGERGRDAAF